MSTIKQDIELQQIDNMEKQRKKLDELKMRIDEKILNKFQCYQKYVHIKGMNDSTERFQQAGNEFITYVMKD